MSPDIDRLLRSAKEADRDADAHRHQATRLDTIARDLRKEAFDLLPEGTVLRHESWGDSRPELADGDWVDADGNVYTDIVRMAFIDGRMEIVASENGEKR